MTRTFALAVVVEAADAEEARRFTRNMLCEGIRWDRPLEVAFVGEGCEIDSAERYTTEEIHLLRDGMRAIVAPRIPRLAAGRLATTDLRAVPSFGRGSFSLASRSRVHHPKGGQMQVFVSVYEHRHGSDVSVHRSEELAIGAAGAIAREWWSEARERDETLPTRAPSSDEEAASLYFEAQDGFELHEIRCCDLEGVEPLLTSADAGG